MSYAVPIERPLRPRERQEQLLHTGEVRTGRIARGHVVDGWELGSTSAPRNRKMNREQGHEREREILSIPTDRTDRELSP